MNSYKKRLLSVLTMATLVTSVTLPPVISYGAEPRSLSEKAKSIWKRPSVKGAAAGAALGTGLGLFTGHTLRGAIVGTGAGAAVGGMHNSKALRHRPVMRTAAQGATVGAGVGAVTGKGIVKGGLIGAGAGMGAHFVKKHVLNKGTCKYRTDHKGRPYSVCD